MLLVMLTAAGVPRIVLTSIVFRAKAVSVSTRLGKFYNVQARSPKSKVWSSADEAVGDVKSGDTLLCGGK